MLWGSVTGRKRASFFAPCGEVVTQETEEHAVLWIAVFWVRLEAVALEPLGDVLPPSVGLTSTVWG